MDKVRTLDAALAAAEGAASLALGGWSFSRRPIAAVRGIAAAGLRFEELISVAGGLETDLMLCAGAVVGAALGAAWVHSRKLDKETDSAGKED